MALSVASQSVLQKQRILASFYEVLVPTLPARGVGGCGGGGKRIQGV